MTKETFDKAVKLERDISILKRRLIYIKEGNKNYEPISIDGKILADPENCLYNLIISFVLSETRVLIEELEKEFEEL